MWRVVGRKQTWRIITICRKKLIQPALRIFLTVAVLCHECVKDPCRDGSWNRILSWFWCYKIFQWEKFKNVTQFCIVESSFKMISFLLCIPCSRNWDIAHSLAVRMRYAWIILNIHPTNERRRYIVTSSLIGWVHAQNDPCICRPPWIQSLRLDYKETSMLKSVLMNNNFQSWHLSGQSEVMSENMCSLAWILIGIVVSIPGH